MTIYQSCVHNCPQVAKRQWLHRSPVVHVITLLQWYRKVLTSLLDVITGAVLHTSYHTHTPVMQCVKLVFSPIQKDLVVDTVNSVGRAEKTELCVTTAQGSPVLLLSPGGRREILIQPAWSSKEASVWAQFRCINLAGKRDLDMTCTLCSFRMCYFHTLTAVDYTLMQEGVNLPQHDVKLNGRNQRHCLIKAFRSNCEIRQIFPPCNSLFDILWVKMYSH